MPAGAARANAAPVRRPSSPSPPRRQRPGFLLHREGVELAFGQYHGAAWDRHVCPVQRVPAALTMLYFFGVPCSFQ